mgnify:CR=1 FL=1
MGARRAARLVPVDLERQTQQRAQVLDVLAQEREQRRDAHGHRRLQRQLTLHADDVAAGEQVEHGGQDRRLVGEVVVERAGAHARGGRDLAHGRGVVATLGEQAKARVEERFALLVVIDDLGHLRRLCSAGL